MFMVLLRPIMRNILYKVGETLADQNSPEKGYDNGLFSDLIKILLYSKKDGANNSKILIHMRNFLNKELQRERNEKCDR